MSQDPYDNRRTDSPYPRDGGRSPDRRESYHPLEEVLRLIDRESPQPWYPREFLRRSGADADQLSAILDHLALERLIEKVPGRSLESGQGIVLTEQGREVVHDPLLMDRLKRGEALREGDTGAAIRQGMRTRVTPYATYALIAANVAVYLLVNNGPWKKYFADGAALGGNIRDGEWWRLITSTFLHGGLLHIGSNMFSLYSVGSFVEQAWGRWRYLVIYFLSGWGGSCLAMAFQPNALTVGASGAVCGVLGAIGVWFLLYRRYIPADFARSGLWQVISSIVLIALIGVMVPNVSNWGHLGGGIAGALASLALHFQRFGIGEMKAPAIRWGLAILLLVALPVASYMQMQRAWAGRELAVRGKGKKQIDDDDDDRKVEKKEKVKVEKEKGGKAVDRGEAGPFLRHHGSPLRKSANALYDACGEMPIAPADIEKNPKGVEKARKDIETHRKFFAEQRDELKQAEYKDETVEKAREQALAMSDEALKLCKQATAHLDEPTGESRLKLQEQYTAFESKSSGFIKTVKALDKR